MTRRDCIEVGPEIEGRSDNHFPLRWHLPVQIPDKIVRIRTVEHINGILFQEDAFSRTWWQHDEKMETLHILKVHALIPLGVISKDREKTRYSLGKIEVSYMCRYLIH